MILRYANNIVSSLGKNVKGKKKLRIRDGAGLLIEERYTEEEFVIERTYDDFGFKISFLEESDTACAIWFANEIVFNTVLAYDAGLKSKYLTKLRDDLRWATFFETADYEEVFSHGEWEDALKALSDNTALVKERIFKCRKETEAVLEWMRDFNLEMLKHIPFRYYRRDVMFDDLREYKDKKVIIKGDPDNQDYLNVWVLEGGKGKKVFDYQAVKYINGAWIDHVKAVMDAEKKKPKFLKQSRKYHFDSETLRDLDEVTEEKYLRQDLTADDYLEQIRLITT